MKNFLVSALIMISVLALSSCTDVKSGHKGVEVSWGGKTNMQQVYPEGLHWGLGWLADDMIEYDVRQKTHVDKFQFNDANNMVTGVEIALDYNLMPDKVNYIHSTVGKDQLEIKIVKTLKSACKEVIVQYTASDLNLHKRSEAEIKLSNILASELPEFHIKFNRVQLTDVDIPAGIAETAEATAKQLELNKLSEKKAEEARNNFAAAEWNAKTKAILSQPAMLELQRVENEKIMWQGFYKHGTSPFGNSNTYGVLPAALKMLK